ncbi:MAG TPA: hypothetical protein PKO06_05275 [Candidatus Ozemobacteraceae bacterium]|nr:hypothetical protein [Candidatus Ozemobacteraceae bacterium]
MDQHLLQSLTDKAALEEADKEDLLQIIEDTIILGRAELADIQLQVMKDRFPNEPEFLYAQARVLKEQGQVQEAYNLFKRLYFEQPIFMSERRDYETTRDQLLKDKLEKAKAQWNLVLSLAQRLASREAPSPKQPPAEDNIQAIKDQIHAEIDKLIDMYNDVLKDEPQHLQALKGLVYCYTDRSETAQASAHQERLKLAHSYWNDLGSRRAAVCLNEARRVLDEEKKDLAIDLINRGLDTAPSHSGLLVQKAEILRGLQKFKEAAQCIEVLLRESPNDSEGLKMKKNLQNDRLEESIKRGWLMIKEMESGTQTESQTRTTLKEAMDLFFTCLDIDANSLRALEGIYRCQLFSNNPLKAKKTLERIKEIDSTYRVGTVGSTQPPAADQADQCFVATRIFGPRHPTTCRLREFRDTHLRHTISGRVFIRWYKRIGPRLAALPRRSPTVRLLARVLKTILPH